MTLSYLDFFYCYFNLHVFFPSAEWGCHPALLSKAKGCRTKKHLAKVQCPWWKFADQLLLNRSLWQILTDSKSSWSTQNKEQLKLCLKTWILPFETPLCILWALSYAQCGQNTAESNLQGRKRPLEKSNSRAKLLKLIPFRHKATFQCSLWAASKQLFALTHPF